MTEKIKVFKHNSICIDVEGRAVYVDPFEMDETPHDAAFILVTHDHYDHFSPEAIEKCLLHNINTKSCRENSRKLHEEFPYYCTCCLVLP